MLDHAVYTEEDEISNNNIGILYFYTLNLIVFITFTESIHNFNC